MKGWCRRRCLIQVNIRRHRRTHRPCRRITKGIWVVDRGTAGVAAEAADEGLRWNQGIGLVYLVDTSISVDETIVYDVIISIPIC